MMLNSKKGLSIEGTMMGIALFLILFFVLVVPLLKGSTTFKNYTQGMSGCQGVGFVGSGRCVDPSAGCERTFPFIGCPGGQICCFDEDIATGGAGAMKLNTEFTAMTDACKADKTSAGCKVKIYTITAPSGPFKQGDTVNIICKPSVYKYDECVEINDKPGDSGSDVLQCGDTTLREWTITPQGYAQVTQPCLAVRAATTTVYCRVKADCGSDPAYKEQTTSVTISQP